MPAKVLREKNGLIQYSNGTIVDEEEKKIVVRLTYASKETEKVVFEALAARRP